jgi:hypothetical protein
VDQADDGLRAAPHHHVDLGEVALEVPAAADGLASVGVDERIRIADVQARAEGASFAAHHDDADIGVLVQRAEVVAQIGGHLRVDGVQRIGPIQREPVDGAVAVDADRLVGRGGHGGSL